jgi:CheY-like chemotaxis protein
VLVVCTETTAQVLTARRLARSEAELREADRRKDEFIAMLAHELRNPLAPIRTGLHVTGEPGLGIGLALVRRLVEMHGGDVAASSAGAGQGSEFELVLPLSVHQQAVDEAQPDVTPRLSCRVVVIDDNRDAANTMAMLIESLGGHAAVAYDGDSGLREALAHRADVVLLDIGMRPVDGYETCRRIRQAMGDAVKVVALTGWGQLADREKAAAAGFDAHLTKPADPEALRQLFAAHA